ncbi:hypothetical protein FCV85_08085 [Vibrio sp. F13]|uniref:hypothetical protein n=1 Tax=Vibrio sp. F13 TaxID=2070777 RepID=UPI0010BDD62E|nr:hypothetical protein [Vibrio sp. F13]TKG33812.1 hypothetical protein FCV85_08085 [Vibrio sp. F13]
MSNLLNDRLNELNEWQRHVINALTSQNLRDIRKLFFLDKPEAKQRITEWLLDKAPTVFDIEYKNENAGCAFVVHSELCESPSYDRQYQIRETEHGFCFGLKNESKQSYTHVTVGMEENELVFIFSLAEDNKSIRLAKESFHA